MKMILLVYCLLQVKRDDRLPKKICDDCMYKVETLYQFWNTTANAEKQLLEWLGEAVEEKKTGSEAVSTKFFLTSSKSFICTTLSRIKKFKILSSILVLNVSYRI